ncbi:MAG: hypothetical protein AB1467_04775 [Candidatus Diapherotrites archaeon]
MTILINSHFFPFRLDLRERKPVQLTVELANKYNKAKLLTMEILLPRSLAFDKAGLKGIEQRKFEEIGARKTKTYYFDIYPKTLTDEGEHQIRIKVAEYMNEGKEQKYVAKEYKKDLELTVK